MLKSVAPALVAVLLSISITSCGSTGAGRNAPGEGGSGRMGQPKQIESVRTTAYTHSEKGHARYGRRNALGTTLSYGRVKSAGADWSRYPVGTTFRVKQTGHVYTIDDYGSALVGTGTIDLYRPCMRTMRQWGVRHVDIEVLQWGCREKSLTILQPRTRASHVRAMVASLRGQEEG